MSVFQPRWTSRGKAKRISPRTPYQGTDITDKRVPGDDSGTFGSFVSALPGHSQRNSVDRCPRCRELEAEGVTTLICSACGYQAEQQYPRPGPEDLKFSLEFVRTQIPNLSPPEREHFEYWLDLMLNARWSHDEAQRGAYAKVVESQPIQQAIKEH